MARLVPVGEPAQPRVLGGWKGRMWVADDFDAPLPDHLLDAFEGRDAS